MKPSLTRALSWLVLMLLSSAIRADVIHYKDGRKLEGVILERTATQITVEASFGTIDVPLSKIDHIEERLTPGQELARQRASVDDDDAEALYQLALWADEQGLRKERQGLLVEVLAADPQHPRANADLGRVELDGSWYEPAELERHLAEVETEMRAQGKLFFEGRWLPEAEVMARQGKKLYGDQWLPRREADIRQGIDDLASLADWRTSATTGEFITVYSDLDDDTLEFLIHDLDSAVRDFLRRSHATGVWKERLTKSDIPIYLPPGQDVARRMLDSGFLATRYSWLADSVTLWRDRQIFGMNWPQAFLVLVNDGRLALNGDPDEARLGFLSHLLGALLIDRYKGSRSVPDWAQVGLQTFYEGATNYHSTLTLSRDDVDAHGHTEALWRRGWETFVDWRDQLRDPAVWASLPSMSQLLATPKERFDSRDAALCWSLVSFLLDRHESEFFDYLKAFDSDPFKVTQAEEMADEHSRTYAATFAPSEDELESEWQGWALARPAHFQADLLHR